MAAVPLALPVKLPVPVKFAIVTPPPSTITMASSPSVNSIRGVRSEVLVVIVVNVSKSLSKKVSKIEDYRE